MACIYNHPDGGCNDMRMIEKMTMAFSIQWFKWFILKYQDNAASHKQGIKDIFTISWQSWLKLQLGLEIEKRAVTHLCSPSSTEQKETQEKQVTDGSQGQMYANYKSQTFITYNNCLYANPRVLGLYVKMSTSLRINAYDF